MPEQQRFLLIYNKSGGGKIAGYEGQATILFHNGVEV